MERWGWKEGEERGIGSELEWLAVKWKPPKKGQEQGTDTFKERSDRLWQGNDGHGLVLDHGGCVSMKNHMRENDCFECHCHTHHPLPTTHNTGG